jgi:hypothetical protein
MKKNKRILVVSALCFLAVGVTGARAAFLNTVQAYQGACSELTGIPGLLQSAGFIPVGNCKVRGDECATKFCEVGGRRGHCAFRETKKHVPYCICLPVHTSQ